MRLPVIIIISLLALVACKNDPDCSVPTFNSEPSQSPVESAKRAAPKPVIPTFNDSLQFHAPDSLMGSVVATSKTSGKQIWIKQVYKVAYDKDMEQDVQDVFIDSLVVKCNYLFVHNERNEVYKIDLKTMEIIKL